MKYRVTCLTPTLVGDGQKLAPIDYMVWKDHVNVLDQRRIFRLLAKGPRLEGYLAQLKKADKLDFASWGGFAQNFAGRRIPFEHASAIPLWETRPRRESVHPDVRRFARRVPICPATAIKGALRTGAVFDRWTEGTHARSRRAASTEDRAAAESGRQGRGCGAGRARGSNRMRRVSRGRFRARSPTPA